MMRRARRGVGSGRWPVAVLAALLTAALAPFAVRAGVPAGVPIARLHTTEKVIALKIGRAHV